MFVGATWLLDNQAADLLGLRADLEAAAPGMGDALLSLAYYLVCEDRSPMRRFHRWAATHAHPFGGPISSQQASQLLGGLDEDVKESLCRRQSRRRSEDEWWVYDTTPISTWSQDLTQARWGFNKDHQPLAQVNWRCCSVKPPACRSTTGN